MRYIKVNGMFELPDSMTCDEFFDKFILWVEDSGGYFAGGAEECAEPSADIPLSETPPEVMDLCAQIMDETHEREWAEATELHQGRDLTPEEIEHAENNGVDDPAVAAILKDFLRYRQALKLIRDGSYLEWQHRQIADEALKED